MKKKETMSINIKNTKEMDFNGLLKDKSFINGAWVSSENQSTFEVTNPYDNSK